MPLRYSDDPEPLETELARWRARALWWAIVAVTLFIILLGTSWMYDAHVRSERILEKFTLPTPAAARSVRV